jgi:hypothetical protein
MGAVLDPVAQYIVMMKLLILRQNTYSADAPDLSTEFSIGAK